MLAAMQIYIQAVARAGDREGARAAELLHPRACRGRLCDPCAAWRGVKLHACSMEESNWLLNEGIATAAMQALRYKCAEHDRCLIGMELNL